MTSGFADQLTQSELKVLQSFREGYVVWPVETGLTESETKSVLDSLRRKVIVTGAGPYRLTAKGKRLLCLYKDKNGIED
jgi:hypothetical protein